MIYVISPDGQQHGPFSSVRDALAYAVTLDADAVFGDRVDEPAAWEVIVVRAA